MLNFQVQTAPAMFAADFLKETPSVRQNQHGHASTSNINYQLQCGGPVVCPLAGDDVELNDEDFINFFEVARARAATRTALIVPLRQWVASEDKKSLTADANQSGYPLCLRRAAIIRKVTVSYAIGELLEHMKFSVSSYSRAELLRLCSIDNFSVHVSPDETCDEGWEVMGVDMISPPLSVQLISNLLSSSNFFASVVDGEEWGRSVEAVITRHSPFCCAKSVAEDEARDDSFICYSLGVLLHFVFSGGSRLDESVKSGNKQKESTEGERRDDFILEPSRPTKAACMHSQHVRSFSRPRSSSAPYTSTDNDHDVMYMNSTYRPLHSFGSIHTVSQVVTNLLDCECVDRLFRQDDAYPSLKAAISDLQLLLREPNIFLIESNNTLVAPAKDKFYGRSHEGSALTDAFCRVASSGHSEAFIIGGFSG